MRGVERTQILQHFYPTRGYHYAVIAEHSGYLRKACSYLCASHVGTGLVQDPAFLDPMQHYEDLYREYFVSTATRYSPKMVSSRRRNWRCCRCSSISSPSGAG